MDTKTSKRIAAGLVRSGALFTCGTLAENLCRCCSARDAVLDLADLATSHLSGFDYFSRFFSGYGMHTPANLWISYARIWSQSAVELQELFILGLFNLALKTGPVRTTHPSDTVTPTQL